MIVKNKTTAAILALFLGGFGVHKFYLGQGGRGVLYFLFVWTFIPSLIALIEAIILFTMSDQAFNAKYNPGMQFLPQQQAQPQNIVVNVANTASTGGDQLVQKLRDLKELQSSGALTDSEYEMQKQRLLAANE